MRCRRPSCACGLNGPLEEFTLEEVRVRVALFNGLRDMARVDAWGACFRSLIRVLESALAAFGPRRMAVLLSTPMSNRGSVFNLSFLYTIGILAVHDNNGNREHVHQLLEMIQGLPLCPLVGSTFHGIVLRSIVHATRGHGECDTCNLMSRVLEGLGAYPLCGCSLTECRQRNAVVIRSGLVGRWHRWHARGARRRWVAGWRTEN